MKTHNGTGKVMVAFALLTLPVVFVGRGQQPNSQLADTPNSWMAATEPIHIVGPIYFVGTKGLGVYLITTPAGHILLGGAMPPSASLIEASIRKLGYKPEDIKLILSNHAHIDHVGTMAELKKLSGATVEVMGPDVALLASGGKLDYLFGKDSRFYFPAVETDHPLKDGEVVELGGVKLTARLTAGHTPGCTTFITTVQEGGKSYQVVFPDGTGINPGTKFMNHPSYPGILPDYRRTFALLLGLHPDIFLPYHLDDYHLEAKRKLAAREGVEAFLDKDGYTAFIAGRKANFEQMVAQEKSGDKQGTK